MIELFLNDEKENILTRMTFPAGETFFKVKPVSYSINRFIINWNYENDAEIFEMANLLDYLCEALDCVSINAPIYVRCPYFPHARQDRYSGVGQPHSLRTLVKIFERFKNRVTFEVADLHNDDASILKEIDPDRDFIQNICHPEQALLANNYDYIICPDKGAIKRALLFAFDCSNSRVIMCEKTRDPSTGRLSEPKILTEGESLKGKNLLIVDDICDGGGTFEMLGKELKKLNPARLDLYVTHGIFSKGLEAMPSIDNFYASYRQPNWRKLEIPEGKSFVVFKTPAGTLQGATEWPWGNGKWPE